MAHFYYDFVNTVPNLQSHTSWGGTAHADFSYSTGARVPAGANNTTVLVIDGKSTNRGLITFVTSPSDLLFPNKPVEILYRWTVLDGYNSAAMAAFAAGNYTNPNAYTTRFNVTNSTQWQYIQKHVPGTVSNIAQVQQNLQEGTWYITRFRVDNSGVYFRTWASGTSEPFNWNATSTDTLFTQGNVGFMTQGVGRFYISHMAFATAGQSASLSQEYERTITSVSASTQQTKTRTLATSAATKHIDVARTVTASAATRLTSLHTVPSSAAVLTTNTRTVSSSGAMLATNTRAVSGSAATQQLGLARTTPLSASLAQTLARTVPSSAATAPPERIVLASAATQRVNLLKLVPMTVAVLATNARTVTSSVAIKQTGLFRTTPLSAATSLLVAKTVPASAATLATGLARTVTPLSAATQQLGLLRTVFLSGALVKQNIARTVAGNATALSAQDSLSVPSTTALIALGLARTVDLTASTIFVNERAFATSAATEGEEQQTVPFSASLYIPPSIDSIITGNAGPLQYRFGMRTYDDYGNALDDISNYVSNMRVQFNKEHTTKRNLSFDIETNCSVFLPTHIVEPYVVVSTITEDSSEPLAYEFPLGRYVQTTVKNSIRQTGNTRGITAEDRVFLLTSAVLEDTLTINTGANYGVEIRLALLEVGFADADILIPTTSFVLPAPLTFEQGKTYYDVVTTLADAINWTTPYMDNQDRLVIQQRQNLYTVSPAVLYATDQESIILPDVNFETTTKAVINAVVVSVNDPLREPFAVTYYNDNVNNEFSRTNTGETHVQVIDSLSHLHNQTVAEERALLETQLAGSYQKLELKTWLDPRRKPFEVYQLYIQCPETGNTVISSNWECLSWTMNLEAGAEMSHQLRVIPPV